MTTKNILTKPLPAVEEVTVEQAASILAMSPERVNRLLDENLIESRNEGDVRRVVLESVLKYEQQLKLRHAILDELTREAQEMGLYLYCLRGCLEINPR